MHPIYSVIVPCYNEEAVLAETHKRLTRVLSALEGEYEILYVNDGSRDKTPDILRDLAARDAHVRAVMFARNAGHQMAVTAGLDYACGDAIIIIDADLQDPPEVIPEMIEKWRGGALWPAQKARGRNRLQKADRQRVLPDALAADGRHGSPRYGRFPAGG